MTVHTFVEPEATGKSKHDPLLHALPHALRPLRFMRLSAFEVVSSALASLLEVACNRAQSYTLGHPLLLQCPQKVEARQESVTWKVSSTVGSVAAVPQFAITCTHRCRICGLDVTWSSLILD